MDVWAQVKTWMVLHVILGYIFVTSGLIICFLMLLTYIFMWPFSQRLYRKIVINLAYAHWCQLTFLAQWWAGCECSVYLENADDEKYIGKEHVIVLMNHKYDIDWLMTWLLAERWSMLGGTKIYGKSSLKMVPLIGWAWMFTESIFLKREWEEDKRIIMHDLQNLTEYPENYWVTLLLFCEGTRFTETKRQASMVVARQKGLPELKHHLLPRTRGFVLTMNSIKGKFDSVLDLTIGFREDSAPAHLMSVVYGRPCKADIYVRRIPLDKIPTDTDENCSQWLHKLYQEKDEIFEHYIQNGGFKIGHRVRPLRRTCDLIVWVCWAVLLCVPLFYYLGTIFLSGSLVLQLACIALIVGASIGVRAMIAVTEIKKGSSYGKTENGLKVQ